MTKRFGNYLSGRPFDETCENERSADGSNLCQQDENMKRAFLAELFGNDFVNSQPPDRHELLRRTLRDELMGNNLRKKEESPSQETGMKTSPKTQNGDMISWLNENKPSSIKGGRYEDTENIPTPKLTVYTFAGTGGGESSQGHIAVSIDDQMYSYGPKGLKPVENDKFLAANGFRDAVAQELSLKPYEIDHIKEIFFQAEHDTKNEIFDYNPLTHNCGDLLEGGLEDLGYNLGVNITPRSLNQALEETGLVSNSQFIPKTRHPDGPDYPWTATTLPGTMSQSDTKNIPKNQNDDYEEEEEEEEEEENVSDLEFYGP